LAEQGFPVGLYRTEFLYLANLEFPDEEAQYDYYRKIAEKYSNTYVVLRTFDLGYDKLVANGEWPQENNPALGWRGIRVMLNMTQVFKTQVRAILRASTKNNLRIMLPMITDVSELDRAKKLISQAKFRLRKDGIPFDEKIQIGIMVEVPSAAMTIETLAGKADFVSIGTNDLTQYTLAVDRMNSRVAGLYSAYHPSVLKLMLMVTDACKRLGKPVSICGEVAGDPLALAMFIGMGIDLLSMNPARIFDICRLVRKVDSSMARHLLSSVRASQSQQQVVNKLQAYRSELEKRTIRRRK
jgi:phosphotransferase system enzyme I (PtsI)